MSDWLADLREEKQRAIARSQEHTESVAAAKAELEKQQSEIIAAVKKLQVEPLLLELQNDILADHPYIFDAYIKREVKSRADAVAGEVLEAVPLSGLLDSGSQDLAAELADGRYISQVSWRLRLNLKDLDGNPARPRDIVISINSAGASINDRSLEELTRDEFQSALVEAFREASRRPHSAGDPGRRRRRRAWYKRLLRSAVPVSAVQQRWAVIILVLIVVLAVAFGLYAKQILDVLLRRVGF